MNGSTKYLGLFNDPKKAFQTYISQRKILDKTAEKKWR